MIIPLRALLFRLILGTLAHICIYVYVYIYKYIYWEIYIIFICLYVYICLCANICVCLYIHTYIYERESLFFWHHDPWLLNIPCLLSQNRNILLWYHLSILENQCQHNTSLKSTDRIQISPIVPSSLFPHSSPGTPIHYLIVLLRCGTFPPSSPGCVSLTVLKKHWLFTH